jgi:hypothetical protein
MFELADNNNLYLEACKAQSSMGSWQALETLQGWIVEKGSKKCVAISPECGVLSALI